ncbi:hypothetical protein F0562_025023 [Nyssa sinensis]|uniref:Suppressor of forked domain-containing protein n=1 Tax=Nyssa sinensis TaxID=561372 RepID=A0A5J5BFL4_9ASTE|nr:hypothetical protein F0562_025023 [Nyssa sinensis]
MADKYNLEAAEILANEALHLPISEAVPIYEQLLATFPTAAKYWKQYVEAHMVVNNDDATKQIFSRCLLNCLHIPLWRCYIRFIRKVNDKKGVEGQEETRKAFDFMLNYEVAAALEFPITTIAKVQKLKKGLSSVISCDSVAKRRDYLQTCLVGSFNREVGPIVAIRDWPIRAVVDQRWEAKIRVSELPDLLLLFRLPLHSEVRTYLSVDGWATTVGGGVTFIVHMVLQSGVLCYHDKEGEVGVICGLTLHLWSCALFEAIDIEVWGFRRC